MHRVSPKFIVLFPLQIRSFFRGVSYPVFTTGVINSLYFGFYGNSLRMIENYRNEKNYRNCCDFGSVYSGWHLDCFMAGCIGGAASTLFNIPVELAKTVSQAHAREYWWCLQLSKKKFRMLAGYRWEGWLVYLQVTPSSRTHAKNHNLRNRFSPQKRILRANHWPI